MGRWVVVLAGVIAVGSMGCSQSSRSKTGSNGSGSGATCSDFCDHLQAGEQCGELDVAECVSSCEGTIDACPSRAPDLLECLVDLRITCTSPGYAVGYGADGDDAGTSGAPASLTSGPGTIEIHDEACAKALRDFQSCPSTGGSAGACVSWRQTTSCVASGAREDWNDKACDVAIESGWSGYCECANGRVNADCGHATATCDEACGRGSF
jgi:hypothetical protein